MKTLKSVALMLTCGLFTTFTVSSCLDSGDNNYGGFSISLSDSINAIQSAQGTYTGKMYYYDPEKKDDISYKGDSIDVNWSIAGTTMTRGELTMEKFPVNALAVYVTNNHSMDKSKEILSAAQAQQLTTSVIPYGKADSNIATLYLYTIAPKSTKLTFHTVYDNNTHEVVIYFAEAIGVSSNYYYYPVAQWLDNKLQESIAPQMQGNILIDKVTVDGAEHKIATVFGIKGNKGSSDIGGDK